MKILIIRMFPEIAKIKNYNMQEIGLAKALIKKGHQCDVLFYNANNENKEEVIEENGLKIKVYWIKGKDILGNAIYDKLIKKIIKQYDIVHSTEYFQIQNIMLHRLLKNRLVIYHGPYFHKKAIKLRIKMFLFDWYVRLFCRSYRNTKIITKSVLAEQLLKKKKYKDVRTIGVGLDADKIDKSKTISEIEKIEQIKKFKKNGKLLGYIGQIDPRRNIDFLFEVFNEVNKRQQDTRLLVIGKGNAEYKENCFNIIKENKLDDRVLYMETINQDSIKGVYDLIDVFLLPTTYEIFGMVLLEAMYYGIPTITTSNGGSTTIIQNMRNGIIADLNKEKWVQIIIDLLNETVKLNSDIISSSIKNNYTWDCLADKFIDVYKSMK